MSAPVELIICPLCGAEIHRHVAGLVETRIRLPSRTPYLTSAGMMLAEMAEQEKRKEIELVERDCVDHYQSRHSLRLSLWRRLGWAWLMRWPTRKMDGPGLGREVFDPIRFIKAAK